MGPDFLQIFDVYSRRIQLPDAPKLELTIEFKYRFWRRCVETFRARRIGHDIYFPSPFWKEIYGNLQWLYGRKDLYEFGDGDDEEENLRTFLNNCEDECYLDFIELTFKTSAILLDEIDKEGFVRDVNIFFAKDNLPYFLTPYVVSTSPADMVQVEQHPQIILSENTVLHNTAREPVLTLLTDPELREANREFLDALEDYREDKYEDCIAKCGSSFESVMKIICDRRGWSYRQTDTAATLLNTILPHTGLNSFFEQPIMLIATIRNRLSSAHGAGAQERSVDQHIAHYTINATASAILLLIDATTC